MRRITFWVMSTLTVLVLLFSYHTSRSSVAAVPSSTRQSAATSSSQSGSSGTFVGGEVMTPYGVVQVQITVEGGRITAADAIQVPMADRHDQMINSQAVPIYNSETVDAQSATIDAVSGATVTWEGYTSSLQSAIDQANL
ncbi:MAG TPA: FMN-binding protein [Intrasporangium sp.]|uniref:FMN-binding protein n=1 Tax=Intrasporangium sp. TaxID=1925024 RepID=UPI002F94CA6A